MKVFVSDQADADLLQIYRYLADRSPGGAESVAREIDRKFENLSHFPFIGRDRSTLHEGMRSVVAYPYVIFYRVEVERIYVARVLHGRRDIDAEFQR
jgi:toxin ParE1/3/4